MGKAGSEDRAVGDQKRQGKKTPFSAMATAVGVIAFLLPLPFAILTPRLVSRESTEHFFLAGGPFMYLVTLFFFASWLVGGFLATRTVRGRRFPSALLIAVPLLPLIPGALGTAIGHKQIMNTVVLVAPHQWLEMLLASFAIAPFPFLYAMAMAIPLMLTISLALVIRAVASWSARRLRPEEQDEGRFVRDIVAAGTALALAVLLVDRFIDGVSISTTFERTSMFVSGLVPPFVATTTPPMAETIQLITIIVLAAIASVVLLLALVSGPSGVLAAAKSRLLATLSLMVVIALPIWVLGSLRDWPLQILNSHFHGDRGIPEAASELSLPELAQLRLPDELHIGQPLSLVLKNGTAHYRDRELDVTSLLEDPRAIDGLLGADRSRLDDGKRVHVFSDRAETGTSLMTLITGLGDASGHTAEIYLAMQATPPSLPAPFSTEPFLFFHRVRYWTGEEGLSLAQLPPEMSFPLVLYSEDGYRVLPPLRSRFDPTSSEDLFRTLMMNDEEKVALLYGDDASVQAMVDDLAKVPMIPFSEPFELIWARTLEWPLEESPGHGDDDTPRLHEP